MGFITVTNAYLYYSIALAIVIMLGQVWAIIIVILQLGL